MLLDRVKNIQPVTKPIEESMKKIQYTNNDKTDMNYELKKSSKQMNGNRRFPFVLEDIPLWHECTNKCTNCHHIN